MLLYAYGYYMSMGDLFDFHILPHIQVFALPISNTWASNDYHHDHDEKFIYISLNQIFVRQYHAKSFNLHFHQCIPLSINFKNRCVSRMNMPVHMIATVQENYNVMLTEPVGMKVVRKP